MDNTFIASYLDWDHRTPTDWQRFANRVLRKLKRNTRLTPAPGDMANVEARMNLFFLIEQVMVHGVPGDVVDIGCYAGDSTIVMQKVVTTLAPEKTVHAYDSFEGLPTLTDNDLKDKVYQKGYMATTMDVFKQRFNTVGLKMPEIHKGWFEDTIPGQLPDRISFAWMDGDLYESAKHYLPHLYERMSPGAIGAIAVYYDEKKFPRKGLSPAYISPGYRRALDEFLADKPEKVSLLYSNEYTMGYFRKV